MHTRFTRITPRWISYPPIRCIVFTLALAACGDGDDAGPPDGPGANTEPTATFSATCTDLRCDYDASASEDPDGIIATYDWDFGDGETGQGLTATHTYAAGGSFTVTLTVIDDRGASNDATRTVTVGSPVLTQVGDPIVGITSDDQDGRSVQISDDGTRVVLSTPFGDAGRTNGGQVRVFEWDGLEWNPLGQTLENPDLQQFSWGEVNAVALSGDGRRLAIGNQRVVNPNGRQGAIWVYELSNDQWRLLGAPISPPSTTSNTGLNTYGAAVAMSKDGSLMAVGAPRSNATVNGAEGAVVVYMYDGAGWQQLGDPVFGTQPGEQAGWSVDMSGDGARVVVGAPSYSALNTGGSTISAGRAFVLDWNGGSWTPIGNAVVGRTDGAADIRLGASVDIAPDGSRFATFGNFSGDRVRVFELDGGSWVQMGGFIPLPVAFNLHHPMSLTERGDRIAIGRPFNVGNNNGGLSIYEWDGVAWTRPVTDAIGETIGDQLGYSVTITPDGGRVIAGVPGWDDGNLSSDNRGGAIVYDVP